MLPDFGWTELLVIAIVLIVVVGPKDLPRVVRGFSKSLGSMRKIAGDFRKQFDDALSEAELDDLKTIAKDVKGMDPRSKIKDALNPLGEIGKEINDELKGVAKSIEADSASVGAPTSSKKTVPAKTAAAKKPVAKKSAAQKPAAKKSAAKPVTKKPVAKKPAAKPRAATKTASAAKPATKKPAAKRAPAKKPAATKAGDA